MNTDALAQLLDHGGVHLTWAAPDDFTVATVTLDRPETRNAQTPATWRALAALGGALPAQTRIVILRGAGSAFSSGIDLRAFSAEGVDGESVLAQIATLDDDAAADLIATFQSAFTWWHDRSDLLTIAVVQGAAVGAGFQLALACDFRLCSTQARFAMREPSLGLVPDLAGTHPLVRLAGYSRALELCVTGRWLSAAEAHAWGLANLVAEPADLDDAVSDLVAALVAAPAAAARATKAVLGAANSQGPEAQRHLERVTQVQLIRGLAGGV